MTRNELIHTLDHLDEEEKHHGPLGGMAWDEIVWASSQLIDQYDWHYADLKVCWPSLFK